MNVNLDIIHGFKPCPDRLENYIKNYEKFNGSFDEFIDLEEITYSDKIWVARRLLNKNQLCHFGLLCAESVLNIFEDKYPADKRVGDCIRYLKSIPDFSNITETQREEILNQRRAAYAAAYDAAAYDARKNQENLNLQFLKMAASL